MRYAVRNPAFWWMSKAVSPSQHTSYVRALAAFRTQQFSSTSTYASKLHLRDPFLENLEPLIEGRYSALRDTYPKPKHPIVLAHGLLGFDELRLGGKYLPPIQYWRGIKKAFSQQGIDVITVPVLPLGSIEQRAKALSSGIEAQIQGEAVNVIAKLRSMRFRVLSLTTISTPHRAWRSAIWSLERGVLARLNIESGAFMQLTRKYMQEEFNPNIPDCDDVRYFSYGASLTPSIWSLFRQSHQIIEQEEGPNDGLVSVRSSKWGGQGGYQGTLMDVSHFDLINWTNRFQWPVSNLSGDRRKFNALALYLDIADMLTKQGL
ncbi:predicted protein [Histoplasma mississippiense (nom. inval.)]|uniref:predicted protein n=1 Tax=Ajellomyces capsulatus (strain NAm1 / WU24) TaxID=2059318 RepID=UPI000157C333|nr:predicted protein [Histoplasma mississippiense (nom. inval.)]EDN07913.1 predicted protein [Histoplasma mississippiense (nom. inval.)]